MFTLQNLLILNLDAIGVKFSLSDEELEEKWQLLRSKINLRVKSLPKLKKFQKKFNIQ